MKTVKKVLFVISNISFGGAQRVVWTLTKCMGKMGVEPVVVAVGHSTNNYTLPEGVKVIQLGQKRNLEALSTIGKMRKVIKAEKPSVVISMGVTTGLFSVPAVLGLNVAHIISERNDPKSFDGKTWVKNVSRAMMKQGSGFVFQTEEARDFYPEKIRNRGCVIPNPIMATNLPDAEPCAGKPVIVTMGRLAQQKNHRLLIDAFALLLRTYPTHKLHIYGFGELQEQTAVYIQEKGLQDSVVLFGACNDVLTRIRDAEMFVLSSDFEGMPNALMEAMAMGLPCISTDCPCGGPRYLIRHGENGLLVPVGDVESMAAAMARLTEDPDLRISMGSAAKQLRQDLSAEKISRQWLDFCEEVIHGQ